MKLATEKQMQYLESLGIETTTDISMTDASNLIDCAKENSMPIPINDLRGYRGGKSGFHKSVARLILDKKVTRHPSFTALELLKQLGDREEQFRTFLNS